ncbi:MAG: glycoside hydrolase domain-containing protein [Kofleriaceae bacterium]
MKTRLLHDLQHVSRHALLIASMLASACASDADETAADDLGEVTAEVTVVLSDWNYMEWEPRLFTGTVGYQGVRLGPNSASITNTAELGRASWYTPLTPIQQWSIYDLSMTVNATASSDGRVDVRLYDENGASLGLRQFFLEHGTYSGKQQTFSFITPAGTTHARVYFTNTGSGSVSFDAATLTRIDASTRTTQLVGNTRFLFTPRTDLADAALSSTIANQYGSRGYVHYRRTDPRFTYPNSIPQPSEVTNKLETFATPGQHAGLWFTTYGLNTVNNVQLSLNGDLVNTTNPNAKISQTNVALKMVRFWQQRSTWTTTNYYVIPELLEELSTLDAPINIGAGANQGFWVHVKVPTGTAPGTYVGHLTFNPSNKPTSTIDIEIEVLPFTLEQPPGINWLMYSDLSERYVRGKHTGGAYTEPELTRYLTEMKEYGIRGIVDSTYSRVGGQLTFDRAGNIARVFKLAGMPGPLVVSGGVQHMAAEQVGIPDLAWMTYDSRLEGAQLKAKYAQLMHDMDTIIRDEDVTSWYYYLTDEPSEREKLDLAIWEGQNVPQDIKTATTLYPYTQLTELAPYLDADMNAFPAISPSDSYRYRSLMATHGGRFWYLGAGTYSTQEGGLMPNRYQAGFMFYKSGGSAHVSWTYQDYEGDPFDDLDTAGVQPKDACITYPARAISTSRASISTLQFEGIREGIDDYKYLHTLKRWMQRARDSGVPAAITAANAAQAEYDQLMASMPYVANWSVGDSYLRAGNFSNADAQEVRRKMKDLILDLKNACPGC